MMKSVVLLATLVCVSSAFPEFTVDVLRKELSEFGSGNFESNVVELAKTLKLNTLVELITEADIAEELTGDLTVFGPTDDAFEELPKGVMAAIKNDVQMLTDVLRYHILGTEVHFNQLKKNELLLPSLLKSTSVRINTYGELTTATGSPISKPDNIATNGVIHVVDRVMFPIPMNDMLTLVSNNANFSTLLKAIRVSGFADTLKGGPYTLFAPTNEAFDKLPPGTLGKLLGNKDELFKILSYHLVNGTVGIVEIPNYIAMMKSVVLLATLVCVSSAFPEFTVDVLRKELSEFGSGNFESNVVELAKTLNLNTLVELITEAGIAEELTGDLTVFGPTDDAFEELPKGVMAAIKNDVQMLTDVLRYHILGTKVHFNQLKKNELLLPSLLKSTSVRINTYGELTTATGSPISKPDNIATNGVIHVVDRVMFPIPMNDMLTLVSNNANFSTLLKAIRVSGFADTLKGGPYTLFAPTNEAFNKLPPGTLGKLLGNKDELFRILSYHLVNGTFFSAELKRVDKVKTTTTDDITIKISSGELSVNDKATVIIADAATTNGVAHVIDTVLLPPNVVFQLVMTNA
ncbi:transforming growth factor-beta-induced protein ig-h3-like [Anneissia japonica]|uniref:transforming growth factor-beta-induced protein ig-h3-like n=1 Tax=Anneissia japonica TaxID=1529436 RepID=UPI0014257354|nr:transforming growth factor-beta-induced protein ig-h3-like [Anneissia japonica]